MRFASAIREAMRILFTGAGDRRIHEDGQATWDYWDRAQHSAGNSADHSTGNSPTTPPVVPTGGAGGSCVLWAGASNASACRDVSGWGCGRSKVYAIPAAAGGGCKYNIVSVRRLGEWFRVIQRNDNDRQQEETLQRQGPVPAKGFRPSFAPDSISRNKDIPLLLFAVGRDTEHVFVFRRQCCNPRSFAALAFEQPGKRRAESNPKDGHKLPFTLIPFQAESLSL